MKQQLDFDNIELSPYAKFILRTLPIFKIEKFYRKETFFYLFEIGMIQRTYKTFCGYLVYKVSIQGKMYFRIKRKKFLLSFIPISISVLALLASYDVIYIEWLHQLLLKLALPLKTMWENWETYLQTFPIKAF